MSLGLGNAVGDGKISPPETFNAGNWTVTFDPPALGVSIALFECYHIVIQGPPGSAFQIFIGNRFYDNVTPGDVNSWDPNQPMKLQQGDTVFFYWNTNALPAPTVTMYFQEVNLGL